LVSSGYLLYSSEEILFERTPTFRGVSGDIMTSASPDEPTQTVKVNAEGPLQVYETTGDGNIFLRMKLTGIADRQWRDAFNSIVREECDRRMSIRLQERHPTLLRRRLDLSPLGQYAVNFDVIFCCEEYLVGEAVPVILAIIDGANAQVAVNQQQKMVDDEAQRQADDQKRKELKRLTDKFKHLLLPSPESSD
jgi:hypothetical protein